MRPGSKVGLAMAGPSGPVPPGLRCSKASPQIFTAMFVLRAARPYGYFGPVMTKGSTTGKVQGGRGGEE